MLSSRIKPDDSDDNDDADEGGSAMPGDYEPWSRAASRTVPPTTVPSRRPTVRPTAQTIRRPPPIPSAAAPPTRRTVTPAAAPTTRRTVTPAASPVRPRRSRRRSITPEIVIERHHRHRLKSGHRIITIPLDNRPTLGLRGPPKRVLELERVRCRRRHRSSCYEIDYDVPPSSYLQPQSNFMLANSFPNPCLLPAQSSLMTPFANNSTGLLASFLNLTPEKIENLPKQIIHLPPIHLPGSQADTTTELDTVVFPAEIINPIDGTLSIIQAGPAINGGEITNIQPSVAVPAQPQLINAPTNVGSPLAALAMTSGPFMQQVHDLFQRITRSQAQPASSPFNHAVVQPSLPVMPQYNTAAVPFNNPQTIPVINTTNPGIYPPANIQPTTIPNNRSFNATTFTPASSTNIRPYPPANITSYQPATAKPYSPANITPYRPANITSYQPASATSYSPANITPYRPANITSYQPASATSYSPANITPYRPANVLPYQANNTTSQSPANITSYRPANITPYQPTSFTPSTPTNIRSYRPASIAPSISSDIGPYRPANITPYNPAPNRSGDRPILPPSIPSASIPYALSTSLASSDSFSSSPSGFGSRPINRSNPPQTPYQSNTTMPKSILRNAPSNGPLNTTYARLSPPSVSSSNSIVREMVTAV